MSKNIFHVLVVDDDDRIRELVKQYLEENNFLVTSAKDALDAKKKLEVWGVMELQSGTLFFQKM